jgi:hypothetical protein
VNEIEAVTETDESAEASTADTDGADESEGVEVGSQAPATDADTESGNEASE